MDFTYSDTVAGYITSDGAVGGTFTIRTADGAEQAIEVDGTTSVEILRNLGEPFQAPQASIQALATPGRYVIASGLWYPDVAAMTAKRIILAGYGAGEYRFEEPTWWIDQIRQLAEFYYTAQFGTGAPDYRQYRTHLTVEGQKMASARQETDTISRMVYGFATAYMLTGEDKYLQAAEAGTEYLREHMRAEDPSGFAYWYHAIDLTSGRERKILASQFGDDYDAIPAYEQIYALAGPVQTYRVTGDPRIRADADATLELFRRFFRDDAGGGYFSHVDPVDFDPRSPALKDDRARKNWNSVGDHAPAYLINLFLATGDESYADMLAEVAGLIVDRFPAADSPFVQERFHEDWSPDSTWGWQQDRAVVGHNLKIAWNLMRVQQVRPDARNVELANTLARSMPGVGMDTRRGGWYDVMERHLRAGERGYRLAWHDRKAWWQQEQAILAYFILSGVLGDEEFLRWGRESAAFYNAHFPDHDSGGVYFNVTAGGLPYLLGTERLKGSHSMSGYHSFELCYLSATYLNLLVNGQPMDLYFNPYLDTLPDNTLRVAPDLLPAGRVRLQAVWVDDKPWTAFAPDAMTVALPAPTPGGNGAARPPWTGHGSVTGRRVRVRCHLVLSDADHGVRLETTQDVAELYLSGKLGRDAEQRLGAALARAVAATPGQMVLRAEELTELDPSGARALAFALQRLDIGTDVYVVGACESVRVVLASAGFLEEATEVADRGQIKEMS